LWRAWDQADLATPRDSSIGWFNLAAVAVALAALAKGPPAAFPVLFFVMLCVVGRHKPGAFRRAATSGAIVTLAVVALPWFVYVLRTPESKIIAGEIDNVTRGSDHGGWFFVYLPLLLVATAPWCAVLPVAVYEAARRWRSDIRLRGLLLWIASVLLPLCAIGNKQPHYLVPLLPPLAMLIGWFVDLALARRADEPLARVLVLCFQIMIGGIVVAVLAMLVTPWVMVKAIRPLDVAMAGGLAVVAMGVWRLFARGGVARGVAAYAVAGTIVMPVVAGLWMPSLYQTNSHAVAGQLRERFGDGPYRFIGDSAYLPLCFAMRREMPYRASAADVSREADEQPGLVILLQRDERAAAAATTAQASQLPPDFELAAVVGAKDQRFEAYRRRAGSGVATSQPSARAPE